MAAIVLRDANTGSTAHIAPQLGFNCYAFQAMLGGRAVDVLDSAADFPSAGSKPSHHGIPILFPFPNRIRGGRFTWNGGSYEIPATSAAYDAAGNAIHGFCLDRPWRVVAQENDFAIGQFQLSIDAPFRRTLWPADFFLEIRYSIRQTTLRADVRIANPDDKPLPWGFGTHPYFRLPLGANSDPKHCLIESPAARLWELVDCLPTGRQVPVPEAKDLREGAYFDQLKLDDVYTGLQPGPDALECVIIDERAGLQVAQRCDPIFRELVAYTPANRNAICLEPYTCVTDAVHLQADGVDAGWRVLEPGHEFRTWFEITAGPVLA